MAIVGLLSYTKSKMPYRCKARNMYSPSPWFPKAYEYVKKAGVDKVFCLRFTGVILPLKGLSIGYWIPELDRLIKSNEELIKIKLLAGIESNVTSPIPKTLLK